MLGQVSGLGLSYLGGPSPKHVSACPLSLHRPCEGYHHAGVIHTQPMRQHQSVYTDHERVISGLGIGSGFGFGLGLGSGSGFKLVIISFQIIRLGPRS